MPSPTMPSPITGSHRATPAEVPANLYLDRRRPEYLDAEMLGAVRYDPVRRIVAIMPPGIYREVMESRP